MDASALTGVAAVFQAFRSAVEATKSLNDAVLQKQLADGMVEASKLAQENAELRNQNTRLSDQLRVRDEMEWRLEAWWKRGDPTDGPYCPRCLGAEGKMLRMMVRGWVWHCPNCTTSTPIPARMRGGEGDSGASELTQSPREPIR